MPGPVGLLFQRHFQILILKFSQYMLNLDLYHSMFIWTEAVKHFAENGNGNVIFLDGSTEGMEKTMKQLVAIEKLNKVATVG